MLYHLALYLGEHIVLAQLVLDNPVCQFGGINRDIDLPEHIRDRSDMILVSVGDKKAFYFLNIVFQVGDIGNHKVDSIHIILRKRQTAVHHNNTVFVLKGSNVHTNLL